MNWAAGVKELGNARTARVAKDKRAQWFVYILLVLAFVVVFTFVLTWQAGLRRGDIGIAGFSSAASVKTHVDAVVNATFVQERVAAALYEPLTPQVVLLTPSDKGSIDTWPIVSGIAGWLTSDAARGRLSTRLVTTFSSECAREPKPCTALRATLTEFRRGTSTLAEVQKALEPFKESVSRQLTEWAAIEAPRPKLRSLLVAPATAPTLKAKWGDDTPEQHVQSALTTFVEGTSPAETLSRRFAEELTSSALDPSITQAASKDFSARVAWAITALLFVAGVAIAVLGGISHLNALVGLKGAAAVAVLAAALSYATYLLLPDIGTPHLVEALKRFDELSGLSTQSVSRVLSALAAAAIVVIVSAAWVSILHDTEGVEVLESRLSTLRWAMNVGTGVLVAGVLEIATLTQLPATLFVGEPASTMTSAAVAVAGAVGILFSLILLLIYVPGAQVLRNDADVMAKDTPAEQTAITALLTTYGFDTTTSAQILRFGQALFPLLAALPASLLTIFQ